MDIIAGIDIGGTKCAVAFAEYSDDPCILDRVAFPTPDVEPYAALDFFAGVISETVQRYQGWNLCALGVACGGPLDAKRGLILSPPNLPKWRNVDCTGALQKILKVPAALQNDADACALAEWKWGAGRGCSNMIFLTFGTGMGAGFILNGRLYSGATNLAGEVGHLRLARDGPEGHGKAGSFEGFCSGGGIARLGRIEAEKAIKNGAPPLFCPGSENLPGVSAKTIAVAMDQGDPLAAAIYHTVGTYLGRGLAVLIDTLNPERIILGGIYGRQRDVLEAPMRREIAREALSVSASSCRILPAALGEQIGDFASVCVGFNGIHRE
jgi:glucokinase